MALHNLPTPKRAIAASVSALSSMPNLEAVVYRGFDPLDDKLLKEWDASFSGPAPYPTAVPLDDGVFRSGFTASEIAWAYYDDMFRYSNRRCFNPLTPVSDKIDFS